MFVKLPLILRVLVVLVLLCFSSLHYQKAFAGSGTANVNVSASVVNDCNINASYTLAFGNYDPVVTNASSGSDLTANGSIGVTCTKNDSVTISLSNGSNYASPNRRMNNGTNYLSYNIYTTSGLSTIWNSTNTVSLTSSSALSATNFTLYGDVPKGQDLAAAAFADTVVATITY